MRKSFKKKDRLGKESAKVIEKGRRIRMESIVMYFLPDQIPRISVVIGRKVTGSVGRNRLKRWTREIFRQEKENLSNYGMTVIYKQGADKYCYKDLKKNLDILWKKAKIRNL